MTNTPYFAQLHAQRKLPGHCGRCGNLADDPLFKTCSKCRAKIKQFAHKKKNRMAVILRANAQRTELTVAVRHLQDKVITNTAAVKRLMQAYDRRIASLEMAVARFQVTKDRNYHSEYGKGFRTGARIERKSSIRELPVITPQELSTMNHAYDDPDR